MSPSDQLLRLTDPQAKAIADVAGPEIIVECKKIIDRRGKCPLYVGECAYTKGYESLAKWIVHSIAPQWYGGGNAEPWYLRQSIYNPLEFRSQSFKVTVIYL